MLVNLTQERLLAMHELLTALDGMKAAKGAFISPLTTAWFTLHDEDGQKFSAKVICNTDGWHSVAELSE